MPLPIKDIVIVLGFALALSLAYFKGALDSERKLELKAANQTVTQVQGARKTEQSAQIKENANAVDLQKKLRVVQSELDAARVRLRQRPQPMPEAARANCQGATGGELSAPDAEVLTEFAAEADGLRAGLGACYDYADRVEATFGVSD